MKSPGFLSGLAYPLRGARFVYVEHRGLAKFWLPPIVLTGAALVGVTMAAISYRDDVVALMWETPTGDGVLSGLARVAHWVLEWIVALVSLGVGLIVVWLLTSIIAAPFNDALSEAVERRVTGVEGPGLTAAKVLRDLWRTIGLQVLKTATYVVLLVPLFIASQFVPVVGPAAYSAFAFCLTLAFLSIDYVDWPAARHELGARQRVGIVFRHPRPMFGLGLGVWILLFIPLINMFFMPAAVAGGTLMFLDLRKIQDPSSGIP